jgi:hypothetical protein
MKYRIEISGRGGEVVIGKVKREFYELFNNDDSELDFEDYVWNDEFFEENEIDIPEDIRPFHPGEYFECDDVAHEYGVSVDSAYITVSCGDDIIHDNIEANDLESIENGLTLECMQEIIPDEILEDGDTYFVGQSHEKGFFQSYEFEADGFDLSKLTLHVTDVDGWELITGASYDEQELEDLGELSTTGKGSDAWLGIVEKD